MPNQVVVLHGWSDTSQSFHKLGDFLRAGGRFTVPLFLGDYISLDDDVRIPDVAKQLQLILQEQIGNGTLRPPFDMIVHSTGGLIAREWLTTYISPKNPPPVKRLLMLAPANYGSNAAAGGAPVATPWPNRFAGTFPLAVGPNRTHGSIIDPLGGDIASETPAQKQQVQDLILQALSCATSADYAAMADDWQKISEQAVDPADDLRHQYLQLNVNVLDDEGSPVDDYFLEFSGPSTDPSDESTVYFSQVFNVSQYPL